MYKISISPSNTDRTTITWKQSCCCLLFCWCGCFYKRKDYRGRRCAKVAICYCCGVCFPFTPLIRWCCAIVQDDLHIRNAALVSSLTTATDHWRTNDSRFVRDKTKIYSRLWIMIYVRSQRDREREENNFRRI